jgi:hypothetical protein
MNKTFRAELSKLQSQAIQQATAQTYQASLLSEIIEILRKTNIEASPSNSNPSDEANHRPTVDAGDSPGVVGLG